MSDRKLKNPGKNPMPIKTRITENTKNDDSLRKFMKKIEEEPLKRDEFSQIRQYLQDALLKNKSNEKIEVI